GAALSVALVVDDEAHAAQLKDAGAVLRNLEFENCGEWHPGAAGIDEQRQNAAALRAAGCSKIFHVSNHNRSGARSGRFSAGALGSSLHPLLADALRVCVFQSFKG